jgi:hypothetical protein
MKQQIMNWKQVKKKVKELADIQYKETLDGKKYEDAIFPEYKITLYWGFRNDKADAVTGYDLEIRISTMLPNGDRYWVRHCIHDEYLLSYFNNEKEVHNKLISLLFRNLCIWLVNEDKSNLVPRHALPYTGSSFGIGDVVNDKEIPVNLNKNML